MLGPFEWRMAYFTAFRCSILQNMFVFHDLPLCNLFLQGFDRQCFDDFDGGFKHLIHVNIGLGRFHKRMYSSQGGYFRNLVFTEQLDDT